MAAIDEIYRYLNEIAPFSTAMDFDNAGFLVGDGKTEVTKALVTLDITAQSVRQAREKGAQLIVSHHPVIFHPLKRLLSNSVPYLLAKEGIGAICAHTNLDMAPGGQRLSGRRFGAFRTDRGGFLRRASLLRYGNPCPAYGAEKLRGVCKREAFL